MTQGTRTFCRICEAACGLLATPGHAGQPPRLVPDRHHPVSRGFICQKGLRFGETAFHPDRLRHPMLRGPDRVLRRASWPEAIARAGRGLARVIERHGPHAVAVYYGNPTAFHALGTVTLQAFTAALGTRNVFTAGTQDCQNKFAGSQLVHGSPLIQPLADLDHCDLALMLGTNPMVSQSSFIHLAGGSRAFERLEARGGTAIWVDPRRSESAARWGEHLPIRPGTDIFLLLALLSLAAPDGGWADDQEGLETLLALARRVPIARAGELTGLGEPAIRSLAERLRASERTAFHMSVGVNMGPFGTLAYVVLQALAYATGNFDRQGGLLVHPAGVGIAGWLERFGFHWSDARSRVGGFRASTNALPGGILADEILTPGPEQVRALVVLAGDPLRSIPGAARLEQAIASLETVVAIDLFENHTGRHADVLLPATSWLERADVGLASLNFQTEPLLQTTGPVLAPVGECREETAILADLSLAIGRPVFGRKLLARAFARAPWTRLLAAAAQLGGRLRPAPGIDPAYGIRVAAPEPGTYLGRGPRTPGHRVRFWHPDLEGEPERLLAFATEIEARSGGLTLIGRRRRLGHNSWIHKGSREPGEEAAWMAREDLEARGLASGTRVRLRTEAGEIELRVEAREGIARGTVVVPHGLVEPQANVNALIPSGPSRIERLSGQHLMTGIPVALEVAG
jgi:formate dehydrogenase